MKNIFIWQLTNEMHHFSPLQSTVNLTAKYFVTVEFQCTITNNFPNRNTLLVSAVLSKNVLNREAS